MKITTEGERSIVLEILSKMEVPLDHAKIVADVTLDADLKGFSSHGIGRFPQYLKGLKYGTINPTAEISIERETVSTALINGNHMFGHVAAYQGMELAMKKAKETGIGMVGIHESNHFGVTGYYSDMAPKEDLIGIAICNTDPAVAPIGGKEPIIGTNPLAISIPSHKHHVSLDMATSASARGKLMEAVRKGEKIPENVALDAEGQPTTDPEAALKGSILSFGAHKGYAIAFIIEILAGPLVRAAFGKEVTGTADPEKICSKGDLLLAIDPSKFVDIKQFKTEVDEFIAEIKTADDILIPGDIELRNIKKNSEEGISVDEQLLFQLREICQELSLDLDAILGEK